MGWSSIEKRRAYHKIKSREWREKHREKTREAVKKSHKKHEEKRKIYRKEYEMTNKEKIRERSKKWKLKNKEKIRDQNLRRMYGITSEDYNNLLKSQDNSCKICLIPTEDLNRKLVVDHCHKTGKIRGLLCMNCNKSLGLLKDSTNTVENMLNYLKIHNI